MADFNEFNNYDNSGSYSGSSYNGNEFDQNSFSNYDLGGGAQSTYYRKGAAAPAVSLNTYIARTFLWMFAGLRPYTPDGLPIVGPLGDLEGFLMACGHEGDGIALSPITGRIVTDLICQGQAAFDINPLSSQRFLTH